MTETPPDDSEQGVIVALGSNLPGTYPGSADLLDAALSALSAHGLRVARASRWWRSAAWPAGAGPDFLNGVAIVETGLSPREVLATLHRIEIAFGRRRADLNGPRTLDLDLIAHGRSIVDSPGLIVPHPRAADRRFVMGPLAEIAPAWVHPVTRETAAHLAARATVGLDAAPQL